MDLIEDISVLNKYFKEINEGGLEWYADDDQGLVFRFESGGGEYEDLSLFLKFDYVEYFQLPLNFEPIRISKNSIDEVRLVSQKEAREIIPDCCDGVDYRKSKYRCYRFYADGLPSPFYVYCLHFTGCLE